VYHIPEKEIKDLVAKGYSAKQLCTYYGCSDCTIYRALKRAGIYKIPSSYNKRTFEQMIKRDMSAKEMSYEIGLGLGSVYRYLRLYSLKIPR